MFVFIPRPTDGLNKFMSSSHITTNKKQSQSKKRNEKEVTTNNEKSKERVFVLVALGLHSLYHSGLTDYFRVLRGARDVVQTTLPRQSTQALGSDLQMTAGINVDMWTPAAQDDLAERA